MEFSNESDVVRRPVWNPTGLLVTEKWERWANRQSKNNETKIIALSLVFVGDKKTVCGLVRFNYFQELYVPLKMEMFRCLHVCDLFLAFTRNGRAGAA